MRAILGLSLLVLWASCAYGIQWSQTPRQQSYSHYPLRTYNYNYPRQHYHYPKFQRSPCSAETPCYEQLLTVTKDAVPETQPDPNAFFYHHKRAGLDTYGIIEEGKRAAQFFHNQYGVNVGDLPDEEYLAPNVTLPGGVRFGFFTSVPPKGKASIYTASQGPSAQFINTPLSIVDWTLSFTADYYSNGAYKGHIPAGYSSQFGSFIFDTCPDESPYNPCRSTLSRKRKGRVIIKSRARTVLPPGVVDCYLQHEEWGEGHIIAALVTTEADGVLHARGVMTFPKSCDYNAKCYTRRLY